MSRLPPLSSSYTAPNAWSFDGTVPGQGTRNVLLGRLFADNEPLGRNCHIDLVAAFRGNGYAMSNGGALHSPLFGPSAIGGTSPAQYGLSGNWVLTGGSVGIGTQTATMGPQYDEVGHHGIALKDFSGGTGDIWWFYFWNGMLTFSAKLATAASGLQRIWPTLSGGNAFRFAGHSDHQGYIGDLFWMRGFEKVCPVHPGSPYIPPRVPGQYHEYDGTAGEADWIHVFDAEYGATVPDLGLGTQYTSSSAERRTHAGRPGNGNVQGGVMPVPVRRTDFSASGDLPYTNCLVVPAPSMPTGGRYLWDPMSGPQRDYFHERYSGPTPWLSDSRATVQQTAQQIVCDGGSLASTSLVSGRMFGKMAGRLLCWYDGNAIFGYDAGSINRELRVTRAAATGYASNTGAVIRASADGLSYVGAWVGSSIDPAATNATLNICDAQGAGETLGLTRQRTPVNTAWTTLRIVPSNATVSFQVNNNSGAITAADGTKWEEVDSYTDSAWASRSTIAGAHKRNSSGAGSSGWNVTDISLK